MTYRAWKVAALFCLSMFACGDDSDSVEPVEGQGTNAPSGTRREDSACDEIAEDAEALLEDHGSCKSDADCKFGPAIDCFALCFSAVNQATDLSELAADGKAFSEQYREEQCACPIADCVDQSDLKPVCREGLCTFESAPSTY